MPSFGAMMFATDSREDRAKQMIDWGFAHLIFGLPPATADKVLPMLDQYAALASKLR